MNIQSSINRTMSGVAGIALDLKKINAINNVNSNTAVDNKQSVLDELKEAYPGINLSRVSSISDTYDKEVAKQALNKVQNQQAFMQMQKTALSSRYKGGER